jgi:DNA-binding CsgD family transcriptional regulator
VGTSPLVGRDEELAFVVETIRGEESRGVVVAGGLGVGKTRLAREALAALEPDFVAEWVASTPSSSQIPFGAVAHLLDDEAVTTPEDRLRLARRIASRLSERAGGRPLILAVDDAQWLDAGTAAVVHQLVVTGATKALLTVRTDDPAPEPVVACWKDGWTERLEVQPLGSLDVERLVGAVVGQPVDRVTLNRFWSLSKGNPLFVQELVLGALETASFTISDGVWSWTGASGASNRLVAILESRISHVAAAGRKVLDTLAVGEPLPVEVLIDLYGADALVGVEQLGLAMVDDRQDEQVRLCHPLYGEAIRAAMGTVERRRVMARLADAMADSADVSRQQRLRVAVWRLDSGAPVSPAALTEAAQIANAMYDHVLAERLARGAVAEGAGLAAALVLGDALNRQGRCLEGLTVLDPLADQARTDQEHVDVAVARHFGLTTEHGFRAEFAVVLLAAERQVGDPRLLGFLRALRASLLCSAGQLDEGVTLALQTVAEQPDEITELRAVSPLVSTWLCSGKGDAACAMTERMLGPALRHREQVPQAPGWVMSLHLPALIVAGRLDDADAATVAIAEMVGSGASADASAFLALARGMSGLYRGQVRSARDSLRECVALLRPIARWRLPFPLVFLAEACALAGDATGATRASEEATELVTHHAIFEGVARRAEGWAALARGERSAALELLFDAADWSALHGQHMAELQALHDAVRLGAVRQAGERLQAVAAVTEGRWAPPYAAHARALTDGDAGDLEAAASGFEELGAQLLAAEVCAQASAAFRAAGLRSRAERAEARAWQLAAGCEGARSPVLEELDRPLPLTRREREVAKLAADGLSSQTIADRLFLSVRTVEGHLQNAFGKLGVNDRRSLATLLGNGVASNPVDASS